MSEKSRGPGFPREAGSSSMKLNKWAKNPENWAFNLHLNPEGIQ